MSTAIPKVMNGLSQSVDLYNQSAQSTATTTYGTTYRGFAEWDALTLYFECQGVTGGTLNVYVQNSWDGTTFYDLFALAQLPDGAAKIKRKWSPVLDGVIYTIGSGTEASGGVALTAGNGAGGHWGDYLRVVMVTGAGTSAGTAQIVRALGARRPHTIP